MARRAPRSPCILPIMWSVLLVAASLGGAVALDLSVPSSWRVRVTAGIREFGTNKTLAQREALAKAAISQIAPTINSADGQVDAIGYWQTGSTVISAMANYDYFTQGTTFKTQVMNALNTTWSLYSDFDENQYNDDAMWWATAAVYAYRAYNDTTLLNHAIATWNHVSSYQITPAQAAAGSTPVKSFPIKSMCNGASMAGGVFWRPTLGKQVPEQDDINAAVNTITTALFMSLSSYLAQYQGGIQYTNAAAAAGNWIQTVNKNAAGLSLDTVYSNDCTMSPSSWVFTYNSGKTVEGLTTLYQVTKNSTYMTRATNIAVAGMKNATWQGSNGVITEGANPSGTNNDCFFKSVWVRALNELYRANSGQSSLAILIHSYIDVQYNAVLELAATGATYSSSWTGPPQAYTAWGQAAALDALVSAISAN